MRHEQSVRALGQVCGLCDFWKQLPQNGECRLFPPNPKFPLTRFDDWCGQYAPEERVELISSVVNARQNIKRWEDQIQRLAGTDSSASPDSTEDEKVQD